MALVVAQWGGSIFSAETGGTPVEIWSNMVSIETVGAPDSADLLAIKGEVEAYWLAEKTTLGKQVGLGFIKVNEFNPLTGLQVTDPTEVWEYAPEDRATGILTQQRPITVARRVTVDDGTRQRTHKGGWFSPYVASTIEEDFRWTDVSCISARDRAQTFLEAINDLAGCTAVVWSRTTGGLSPISRVRVGDVPDNISRRKNAMRENYYAAPVS